MGNDFLDLDSPKFLVFKQVCYEISTAYLGLSTVFINNSLISKLSSSNTKTFISAYISRQGKKYAYRLNSRPSSFKELINALKKCRRIQEVLERKSNVFRDSAHMRFRGIMQVASND